MAPRGAAVVVAVLCLLAIAGSARADLTGQLVADSDNMANIVGAAETMSLVDYKLHKVSDWCTEPLKE